MIEGKFDSKTLAAMNAALDRICEQTQHGERHSVRKRIARQIIRRAESGQTTLAELTAAGERALNELAPAAK
jgi:predicted MarR family transcription regulator